MQNFRELFLSLFGIGKQNDFGRALGIITGFFFIIILIGLLALISYVASCKSGFVAIGFALLLAGGAVISNFLLGFLFGMPRVSETQHQTVGQQSEGHTNTNLEQIADWLTKIIVGIGLAEFRKVLAYTERFIAYVDSTHGLGEGRGAFVIIFYFAPLGFLLGYFYARTFFARLFASIGDEAGAGPTGPGSGNK